MKKLLYLIAFVAISAAFVGCKPKITVPKPGDAAVDLAQKLKNEDYDVFVEYLVFDEPMTADILKEEKAKTAVAVKNRVKPIFEQKGGLKDVVVKSEDIAADGNNATVVLTNTYNNGDMVDVTVDMVKAPEVVAMNDNTNDKTIHAEQGVWKVKVGPHKEVWKTRTADGHREVIKLKEYEDKEVFKVIEDGEKEFVKDLEKNGAEVEKVLKDGEKEVTRTDKK